MIAMMFMMATVVAMAMVVATFMMATMVVASDDDDDCDYSHGPLRAVIIMISVSSKVDMMKLFL